MPVVLNENITEKKKSIYDIMKFFNQTPRTEVAFYLRFQLLPKEEVIRLMNYYNDNEEWHVFKKICKYWCVKE